MKHNIPVQHPEWLPSACADTIRTLNLIKIGRLPKVLVGSFIETAALRLLRCVHGTDVDSVFALIRHVRECEQLSKAVELANLTDVCGEALEDSTYTAQHTHRCIGSFSEHIEADNPQHVCYCGFTWENGTVSEGIGG